MAGDREGNVPLHLGEIDGFAFFMTHKRAELQEVWLDRRNRTPARSSPATNRRGKAGKELPEQSHAGAVPTGKGSSSRSALRAALGASQTLPRRRARPEPERTEPACFISDPTQVLGLKEPLTSQFGNQTELTIPLWPRWHTPLGTASPPEKKCSHPCKNNIRDGVRGRKLKADKKCSSLFKSDGRKGDATGGGAGTHHGFAGIRHPRRRHSQGLDSGFLRRKRTTGTPAGLVTGQEEVCLHGTLHTADAGSTLPLDSKQHAFPQHQETVGFSFTRADPFLSLDTPSHPHPPRALTQPDVRRSSRPTARSGR